MARVRLFGILRRYVAAPLHEAQGATVRDVLESLCAENAQLQAAIFDGATLRQHVHVMINGRDVELVQGLLTPLAPDDEMAIFPPIAGG